MKHVKSLLLDSVFVFKMLKLQQSELLSVWEKCVIYWHTSSCMSKALRRVTSKDLTISTSSMWRSSETAAGWVLRGCSE